MGSILQYLHPSLWGDVLHSSVNDMGRAAFWAAVLQVIFINMLLSGDIVMSLDNVIAVAAIAQGSLVLLAIGLIASIPIIIAGAALIMVMLDRFPIFIWAGAALLGWVAGDVMATDPAVFVYVSAKLGETFARQVEFAAAGAGAVLVLGVGGLWRHLSVSKALAVSAADEAGSQ